MESAASRVFAIKELLTMILFNFVDHEFHDPEYACQIMLQPHHLKTLPPAEKKNLKNNKTILKEFWSDHYRGIDEIDGIPKVDDSHSNNQIKMHSKNLVEDSYKAHEQWEKLQCWRYMKLDAPVEDLLARLFDFRTVQTATAGMLHLLCLQRVNSTFQDVIRGSPSIAEALTFRTTSLVKQGPRFNHYLLCPYGNMLKNVKISADGQTCTVKMQRPQSRLYRLPTGDERHHLSFEFEREIPPVVSGSWQGMYAFQGCHQATLTTLHYACHYNRKEIEIWCREPNATFGMLLANLLNAVRELPRCSCIREGKRAVAGNKTLNQVGIARRIERSTLVQPRAPWYDNPGKDSPHSDADREESSGPCSFKVMKTFRL